MTSLWVLPPAVVLLGAVPAGLAAARLAAELRAFRADVDSWASVRPSLSHLNEGTNVLVDRFQGLRDR